MRITKLKIIVILFIITAVFIQCNSNNTKTSADCDDFKQKQPNDVRFQSAKISYQEGDYKSSLDTYQDILESAKQKDNLRMILLALENIALVYMKIGNLDKAEKTLLEAQKRNKFIKGGALVKNSQFYALNLESFGKLKKARKKYKESIQSFKKALRIYHSCKRIDRVIGCLNHIGGNLYYLKDYNNSLKYFYESAKICQRNQRIRQITVSFFYIGKNWFMKKNYKKAKLFFFNAFRIDKKYKNSLNMAQDLNQIAKIYIKEKNLPKAQFNLEKSLSILDGLKETFALHPKLKDLFLEIAKLQRLIGRLHYKQKKYQQARIAYDLILKVFKTYNLIPDHISNYKTLNRKKIKVSLIMADILMQLGKIAEKEKKINLANHYFKRSYEILTSLARLSPNNSQVKKLLIKAAKKL